MRIGIVSKYYKNYNYGGLLQSYALVNVIKSLGHDAVQISLVPNNMSKVGIAKAIKNKLRKTFRTICIQIKCKKAKSINVNMNKFMLEIPHTKKFKEKNMSLLNLEFDAFIAGSDQIWNPGFAYNAYFLDFVDKNKLKIAYAASIGVMNCTNEEKNYLRQMVSNFDFISVREYEGKCLLNQLIPEKNIYWLLDPVFLLPPKAWDDLDRTVEMNLPNRYAVVYLMSRDKNNKKLVDKIISDEGLEKIIVPFIMEDYSDSYNVFVDIGPREFVTLIKNATVVYTDSFHATSVAIINGVNFYCFNRSNMNSRIDSLFRMTGIEPRWITCFEDYIKISSQINYDDVHNKIEMKKIISIDYLKKALKREKINMDIEL